MRIIGAAINVARELPAVSSLAEKAIQPVSRAFKVAKDLGVADKLKGITQLGIG